MTALTPTAPIRFAHQITWGDRLLSPLAWCGSKWDQLGTFREDAHLIEKAAQIAWRVIPAAMLTLATAVAAAVGTLGSVAKSLSSPPKQAWGHAYFDVPIDATLKGRLRETGIDNPTARDWQVADNWIDDRLPNIFTSVTINRSSLHFCGGKMGRVIHLCPAFSRIDGHIFSNLYRDFTRCFEKTLVSQDAEYSIEGLEHFLLGFDISPKQREKLTKTISSTDQIDLEISDDLNHFRIILS